MEEIWKDIEWYELGYKVSNLGNIKTLKQWKENILTPWKDKIWYLYVLLYINWLSKTFKVHRLVAQQFISNPDNKPEVNHINWIKTDNRLENLEWVTKSENSIHSYRILWNKNHFQINNPFKWKFWFKHNMSKKVNQYSLDWEFIKSWDCISDITRILNIDNSAVSKVCRWKYKTAWWFIWKYKI